MFQQWSAQNLSWSQALGKQAFHKILFGRDQLTSSRARGAQKARVNSLSPFTQLDGLIPCCDYWYTKANLLGASSVFKQLTSSKFSISCMDPWAAHLMHMYKPASYPCALFMYCKPLVAVQYCIERPIEGCPSLLTFMHSFICSCCTWPHCVLSLFNSHL